jgi:hypothetical protein
VILGWTVLQRSVRERQLWVAAAVVLVACFCTLLTAALMLDPRHPFVVWAAALFSAVAAIWALKSVPQNPPGFEIAIGADGELRVRRCEAADEPLATAYCMFVAPWLITLRCGGIVLPVWPDSLPASAFRRLHACARWAAPADTSTRGRRAQSNDDETAG